MEGDAVIRRRFTVRRRGAHAADRQNESPNVAAHGKFRPDIEGLRAVAVLAVLLYHAGVPLAPGGYVGVDIFFVISGFLITRLLVDELERTGTVSIRKFYVRRIKRLLPAALTVLAAIAALSWVLLEPVRRTIVSLDIAAAGAYVANWRLSAQAIDYFTEGLSGSPILHFWSLSVEEQFYFVWPSLLLALTWWHRRSGRNVRPMLLAGLLTVAGASLAYSVHLTAVSPRASYFSTFTRGWELALGGIVALLIARTPLMRRGAATALGVLGFGAIGWSMVTFDDNTLFPGAAALVPTLGIAAIIVAGSASPTAVPTRLLGTAPMRYVGRISYSWYLWHWPALVFATAYAGKLSWPQGLAVVAGALVPTTLTYHWIEDPIRRSRALSARPNRAYQLGAACTATAMALGVALYMLTPTVPTMPPSRVVGAAAHYQGPAAQPRAEAVRPNPATAKEDRGQMYEDGCMVEPSGKKSPPCVYGKPSSDTTVVLFGDSHAMQWFPAVNNLAEKKGWRLIALAKSGCPAAKASVRAPSIEGPYDKCDQWRADAVERIKEEDPDLIVMSGLTTYYVGANGETLERAAGTEALKDGYTAMFEELSNGTSAKLAVIKDTPHPAVEDVPACVSRALNDLRSCATPRSKARDYPHVLSQAARQVDGIKLIDATPMLCRDGTCPAVIGNALVYRNGFHITATYMRTLTGWLGDQLPEPN